MINLSTYLHHQTGRTDNAEMVDIEVKEKCKDNSRQKYENFGIFEDELGGVMDQYSVPLSTSGGRTDLHIINLIVNKYLLNCIRCSKSNRRCQTEENCRRNARTKRTTI